MLAPLRHRPFRFLVAGRVSTMLGNAVAPIAVAFAVLDLTGSVAHVGLVVGARSLFNVVFLLFGGVIGDRFPRHIILVISSLLAALSQGLMATLILTDTATVPLLVAVAAVNGAVSSFALPASLALLPQTVPVSALQQANALSRLGSNAAMIMGASLGGLVVATVGPGWGLVIDATTFVVSAGCFWPVRMPSLGLARPADTGPLRELRDGWREFVSRTWVWVVVLAFSLINAVVMGGVHVLGPAVADETIGRRGWGLVLAAETAGMVVGALIAMRVRVRRLLFLGVVCAFGLAILLGTMALAPYLVALLPAAFIGGIAIEQFTVAWETSLQRHIPAEKLARVYSYDALGSYVAIPLGEVAAGPIALAVGTGPALLGGAGVVAISVFGMIASRDVRRLEYVPSIPVQPADTSKSSPGATLSSEHRIVR